MEVSIVHPFTAYVGVSAEATAGMLASGANLKVGLGFACDPAGNMAIIGTLGGFLTEFIFNEETFRNFTLGGGAGFALEGTLFSPESVPTVQELAGQGYEVSIGAGEGLIADLGLAMNSDYEIVGVGGSVGIGGTSLVYTTSKEVNVKVTAFRLVDLGKQAIVMAETLKAANKLRLENSEQGDQFREDLKNGRISIQIHNRQFTDEQGRVVDNFYFEIVGSIQKTQVPVGGLNDTGWKDKLYYESRTAVQIINVDSNFSATPAALESIRKEHKMINAQKKD